MNKEKEIWKPVTGRAAGYPYEVSNLGRVRRSHTQKIRKQTPDKNDGYIRLRLCDGDRQMTAKVHTLVADAFLDPPPGPIGRANDEWQIDHKDDDKTNCRASNLEWVTGLENKKRAENAGLYKAFSGEQNGNAKLSDVAIFGMKKLYKTKRYTKAELSRIYPISDVHVGRIVDGRNR